MKFEGIIPAIVTPFDRNEEVDYAAVSAVADRLISQGIGGLFVCGSTGEWFVLSEEERMKIVDRVIETAAGRTKIMVHVGAASTRSAVALARHAQRAGAQAVSVLPPIGRPYPPALIWEHFRAIADSTSLPLYLYHLPQVYGDLITIDKFVEAMDKMPTLAGAKFSSYRIDDMIHLKVKAAGRLNILSGCGEQLLSAVVNGAEGSICTWYNLFPRLGSRIIACAKKGELDEARRLQDMLVEFGVLCSGNVLGNIKWLLSERGLQAGIPRRPSRPTAAEECARLLPLLKALGIFDWCV
jgi:N-acetylneuraminate lyase